MADFNIIETPRTDRRIEPYHKIITLEEGGKLADTAALLAVANKTCPAGYKVTARVTINIDKIEVV